VTAAVEATLTYAASAASDAMIAELTTEDGSAGEWLASRRDPRDAREARERSAADATRAWLGRCDEIAIELAGAASAIQVVGEGGLRSTLASAALGVDQARTALAMLTTPVLGDALDSARDELAAARKYCINREALDLMKPTDISSLAPDASAKVRLRRAELRGLL